MCLQEVLLFLAEGAHPDENQVLGIQPGQLQGAPFRTGVGPAVAVEGIKEIEVSVEVKDAESSIHGEIEGTHQRNSNRVVAALEQGKGVMKNLLGPLFHLLELVRVVFMKLPVRAMDVVEVAPPLDHSDITAFAALKVIYEAWGVVQERSAASI